MKKISLLLTTLLFSSFSFAAFHSNDVLQNLPGSSRTIVAATSNSTEQTTATSVKKSTKTKKKNTVKICKPNS